MENELTLFEMLEEERKRQEKLKNETTDESIKKEVAEIKKELMSCIRKINIPIEDIKFLYFYITSQNIFKTEYAVAFAYTDKPYDEPIDWGHCIGAYSKKRTEQEAIDLLNALKETLKKEKLLVLDTSFDEKNIFKVSF